MKKDPKTKIGTEPEFFFLRLRRQTKIIFGLIALLFLLGLIISLIMEG